MSDRKLATIRRVAAVNPIDGAEYIEAVMFDGWQVVCKKGDFDFGDLAVYFEIDSFLVQGHPGWQFLVDKSSRTFNGETGHVLRTVRLRKALSQGLALPLAVAFPLLPQSSLNAFTEGEDVTEVLGVQKYEKPISPSMAGTAKGNFPSFLRKTDAERCQNLKTDIQGKTGYSIVLPDERVVTVEPNAGWQGVEFEVTEKLDGTSFTAYLDENDIFGVCSRNLNLVETEGNLYWQVARKHDIEKILRTFKYSELIIPKYVAIQGEIVGYGVQDNKYKLPVNEQDLYVFNMLIDGKYLSYDEICIELAPCRTSTGPFQVPLKGKVVLDKSVAQLLESVDGTKSVLNPQSLAEGEIWRNVEKDITFKVISNKWLEKFE